MAIDFSIDEVSIHYKPHSKKFNSDLANQIYEKFIEHLVDEKKENLLNSLATKVIIVINIMLGELYCLVFIYNEILLSLKQAISSPIRTEMD